MQLENLHLINFKNYSGATLDFSSKINVLVGKNGSGKTNLLDAIYYLSYTKSSLNLADHLNILHGQDHFYLKGRFCLGSKTQEISCSVKTGSKKDFRESGNEYHKLSEHIGKYPVVMMAPDDVDLVRESSEARRRFFDSIISQIDKVYLESLIQYNHGLKQRNSLLRMFQETGKPDWTALESYDHFLVPLGNSIYQKRNEFVSDFLPVFKRFFDFLVDENEVTDLVYQSGLAETGLAEGLFKNRQRDIQFQRTNFGIHRDEYQFILDQGDLKRLGSQGQQKSFIIALKLAQFEIIKKHKGFNPILLLDDIFDKLDDFRIAKLLELIKSELGQLFITDARPELTHGLLSHFNVLASFFVVKSGSIKPL